MIVVNFHFAEGALGLPVQPKLNAVGMEVVSYIAAEPGHNAGRNRVADKVINANSTRLLRRK